MVVCAKDTLEPGRGLAPRCRQRAEAGLPPALSSLATWIQAGRGQMRGAAPVGGAGCGGASAARQRRHSSTVGFAGQRTGMFCLQPHSGQVMTSTGPGINLLLAGGMRTPWLQGEFRCRHITEYGCPGPFARRTRARPQVLVQASTVPGRPRLRNALRRRRPAAPHRYHWPVFSAASRKTASRTPACHLLRLLRCAIVPARNSDAVAAPCEHTFEGRSWMCSSGFNVGRALQASYANFAMDRFLPPLTARSR